MPNPALLISILTCCLVSSYTPSAVRVAAPYAAWIISWSTGMPPEMTRAGDESFFFDFPNRDGVHYVTTPAPIVQLGQRVTMTFAIVGDGKILPAPRSGDPPARVRLFLQQRGDTLTADEPYKRWWSAPAELVEGEFELTATLTPENWSSVFGQKASAVPAEFEHCLVNLGKIGFTFGGTFAGHGVYAVGKARFVLKTFSVI